MTTVDCSNCPMCSLVSWLDDKLDEKVEEIERCISQEISFENIYKFHMDVPTWKRSNFTKQRILNIPMRLRNKVREICVKYCRSHRVWTIEIELSGY